MTPGWVKRRTSWLDRYRQKKENTAGIEKIEIKSEEYAVVFTPVKCPRCKTKNTSCYKSSKPIRYHKCKKCGLNFKSIEIS